MATIRDFFTYKPPFNLTELVSEFSLDNFVETGTGRGDSVDYVLNTFKNIKSIEIHPEIVRTARNRFNGNNNVTIIEGHSTDKLKELVPSLKGNTLFWLDAHFPGADFGYAKYEDEKDENKRIPLKGEIGVICEGKDFSKDVFIIDDLRVYEDGPFESGNWPKRVELGSDNIDFIYELLDKTHEIVKDFRYQGFLIIKPKKQQL